MKGKRFLTVGLTALMSVTAFAGCSSSTPASSGSGSSTEVKDIKLTVWAPSEDVGEGGWLETELNAFKDAHPEWRITFTTEGVGEDKVKEKITNDAEAAADVFLFANDQIPDLVAAGAIAKLGGSTVEQVKSQNSQTTINTVTYDGAIYGVPFTSNTWFMYYDKRVFTEDDVKNLDTMLEKGKVAYPLTTAWYFAAPYVANGCTLFGTSGSDEAAGFDFTGDKAVAVTDYLIDLVKNPNFVNYGENSSPAWLNDQENKANAIFSGTWDYDNVVEALGGKENVGIAPAPTITINGEQKQLKAFAGSKAVGVNAHCEYPEVAVALAAFLGGTDAQKAHYDMRNIIPTDISIDLGDDALAKAQVDTMDYASIVQPVVKTMGNFWDPAAAMGSAIVNGDVTHDNAAEKIQQTNDQMNNSGL